MEPLICKDIRAWRGWLEKHHQVEGEIYLVFFKGQKAKEYITYDQALDEALCFGWIDNLVRRIDDEKYSFRFTKRNVRSKWSPGNKKRIGRLIREGRIAPAGLALVKAAKANGSWENSSAPPAVTEVPSELKKALAGNKKANEYFKKLAPSHKKQYIQCIAMAKRKETTERRVKEAIRMLEERKDVGLK